MALRSPKGEQGGGGHILSFTHPKHDHVAARALAARSRLRLRAATFLLLASLPYSAPAQVSTVEVLALTGDPLAGGTIDALGVPVVVSPGLVALQAEIERDSPDTNGVFLRVPGLETLFTVALEPHDMPGGQEVLIELFSIGSGGSVPTPGPAGDTLFNAQIEPAGGGSEADGVFLWEVDTDLVREIVRDEAPTPDGNGMLFFRQDNRPVVNEAAQVAFWAEIFGASGGLGDGSGIFRDTDGSLQRIARTGQPLPDGGGLFDEFTFPSMNEHGDVAFVASIDATGEGIYRGDGTALVKIVRTGDVLVSGWEVRDLLPSHGVPVNDGKKVAFRAIVEIPGETGTDHAVYVGDGTTTELRAYNGQPLARGAEVVPFPINRNVSLNNAGQVLFQAGDGLYRSDAVGTTKIAAAGDPVPGTVGGAFIGSFFGASRALNERGDVAFTAIFQDGGENHEGLFLYADDTGLLPPLVQSDGALAAGTVFDFFLAGTSFTESDSGRRSGLDDEGTVAFKFRLNEGPSGIAAVELCVADADRDLVGVDVTGTEVYEACNQITASTVTIFDGGDLTLRAGNTVALEDGFSTRTGGELTVAIEKPPRD